MRGALRVALAAIALSIMFMGSAAAASGPDATVSPTALTFHDVPAGARSDAQAVTLTNTGDAPLTISTFRLIGPDAADFGLGAMCPVSPDTLPAGASCTIYVSFSPDTPGPKSATLAIGDDAASGPQTVALSGAGSSAYGGTAVASVSPGSLSFGDQAVGAKSGAQAVTVRNSGAGPLTISTFRLTGADAGNFAQGADCPVSPEPLPAGSSCTVYVSFTPDGPGSRSATLEIGDDDPSSPQTVALSGNGVLGPGEPTISPASLAFPDRPVGSAADAQAITVTNTGPGALSMFMFHLTGPDAADFGLGAMCPVGPDTLPAGASCSIYVSFTPHSGGPKSATLSIGDNAPSGTQTIALSGGGISSPEVSLSTAALAFGSVTVGTASPQQSVSVTNTGGGPLALGGIGFTGAAAAGFSQTNDCPGSLAAGASCSVSVTFAPASEGVATASLTLTDDAAGSPQAVALSGGGVAPGTFLSDDFESGSLALWDALSSSDSTIALDSTTANSGTSAVRFTNGSGGQSSRLYANLAGGGHAQSYTRFCFRIAPGLTEGIEIANGRAITEQYPLGIRRWEITYNPVTHGLEGYFWNDALHRLDLYAANGQVLPGEWHCAQLYLDESMNGEAVLWLDGAAVGSVAGDLSTPAPFGRLYLWNQPSAGTVWFDDVKVAGAPIG